MWCHRVVLTLLLAVAVQAQGKPIGDCPGYEASNVKTTGSGLTADLKLAGDACNTYGTDLQDLVLTVDYQTDSRLHVKIYDAAEQVYQVPKSVVDTPEGGSSNSTGAWRFVYEEKPFSFAVQRTDTDEAIFNTTGSNLVFQSQYLRLRTSLPQNPYIYGLGEDSDPLRRKTDDYTRTLWSRDAGGAPPGTNLYGNHPIYFEHRADSGKTHGVFLYNSNGMDIKINNTDTDGQYLEYNTLGGVVDLYFLAGPGPIDVAQQYSEVVGKPAMFSYWHFGFHQCKYGYRDIMYVAEVVLNYSRASIPLETMWTDIDYMNRRQVFTLDQDRYPLNKVRDLVGYLHEHDQHYIVMVDPAVAKQDNDIYKRGVAANAFLKNGDGSVYEGVVWPGVTVFPDWFAEGTQDYWTGEFQRFFDADTGVDIDALWIDMNEAANMCNYPCTNATQAAIDKGNPPEPPPVRTNWPALPGFPESLQPPSSAKVPKHQPAPESAPANIPVIPLNKRQTTGGDKKGLPNRDLVKPGYRINNAAGELPNMTLDTNLTHANGLVEYDTHNLYGTMMSTASRNAMLARRPTRRPLIITRSTFAGAGAHVGKWLGDNVATWDALRESIYQIQAFAGIYQIPMVGSDVCGFLQDTTEELCARWASAGAFYPFYRNHANDGSKDHEFYRWESVTRAAKKAIDARYKLLDYIYTAMHETSENGTPLLNPIWFLYPQDKASLDIGLQYFYGDAILVSPVTVEGATSVDAYLPDEQFYDFFTFAPIKGTGAKTTISNVAVEDIPVHIRGGKIVPLRVNSANTTTALRKEDFNIVIAPGKDGKAKGRLYLDDGDSINQAATSEISFDYDGAKLTVGGTFGYQTDVKVKKVTLLGVQGSDGSQGKAIDVDKGLGEGWTVDIS